jgi:hypothetical protein
MAAGMSGMTAYLEMAQRLFPRLQKRDGNTESEVKAAEARLGFALPAELRAMVRLAGRRRDLHGAHDRLVPLKNMVFVNGALVFYEQAERLAAWGILEADLAQADPPVVTASNEPPFSWCADHDTVSGFFFTQLLWTHVNTDPHATLPATPETVARVRARLEAIPLDGCHWGMTCWGRGGLIAMVGAEQVWVGATSDEELEAFLS